MNNFDGNFREIWHKRSINIVEYEYCHDQWVKAHDKKMIGSLMLAILFFALAIWFTYIEIYLGTVITLALAVNFNSKSNHHVLSTEILNSQYLSSKLLNRIYMNDDRYLEEIERFENRLS